MTTIHVTASRDYDVLVQPGLLDDAGAQIAQVLGTGRTAAIVSGETVAGLYAARLAASLTRAGFRAVTFPYPGHHLRHVHAPGPAPLPHPRE